MTKAPFDRTTLLDRPLVPAFEVGDITTEQAVEGDAIRYRMTMPVKQAGWIMPEERRNA